MKCPHCLRHFRPLKKKAYICSDFPQIYTAVSQVMYTAVDCPHCGGQILLGHRRPRADISDKLAVKSGS